MLMQIADCWLHAEQCQLESILMLVILCQRWLKQVSIGAGDSHSWRHYCAGRLGLTCDATVILNGRVVRCVDDGK